MEVLSLKFDAATESMLVVLDAVNEKGITVIGGQKPTVQISLSELGGVAKAFAGFLADLEPLARAKSEEELDPKAYAHAAADLAERRHELLLQEEDMNNANTIAAKLRVINQAAAQDAEAKRAAAAAELANIKLEIEKLKTP